MSDYKKTTITHASHSESLLVSPESNWVGEYREHFDEIESTQNRAIELLRNGKFGAVVTAKHQRSGMGRLGRSFWSPANQGLYVSVTLPVPNIPERYQMLSLWSGLVVIRAIREAGVLINSVPINFTSRLELKWPNDVLLDGKKIAGILVNGVVQASNPMGAVLGVGININQLLDDFPLDLKDRATSIRIAIGEQWDISTFLEHFIRVVEKMWFHLDQPEELLLSDWLRWGPIVGSMITIFDNEKLQGRFVGLNHSGELVLEFPDGSQKTFTNGTTFLP